MVIVDDVNNNDEAFTLQTLSSEHKYKIILHITPIFSNLHKMGGK
jgi:hypothetical protein